MNKIIFFTSRYPFQTVGENFFESELAGVAPQYDEVYIVTCNCTKKDPPSCHELPPNVTALSLARESSRSLLLRGVFALPFHAFFWKELRQLRRTGLPFFPGVRTLINCGAHRLAIRRRLPAAVRQIPISAQDHVTLFGYWLGYVSMAALDVKKLAGLKNAREVSRAHGPAEIQNLMMPNRFYPFQQYLLEKLDGIFAISDAGQELLRSRSPRPEIISRVYIGSMGPEKLTPHCRAPFTIMTCANFFAHKRIGTVADAVHLLLKKIPDLHWVHFGDGPLRAQVEAACADIAQHVTFMGNCPHQELLSYLASGEPSVFVSASAAEGLPVSIMEAIAYATPVVATDVNATREAVVTGITGTLVDANVSPGDLADSIYPYAVMEQDAYDALCRKTYAFWQEHFDCRQNSRKLSEELKSF